MHESEAEENNMQKILFLNILRWFIKGLREG